MKLLQDCNNEERPLTPHDFMLALCSAVDQERGDVSKPPEATLSPRAVVPLALLLAVQGGGMRACYRWLTRDDVALCPQGPARPRVARLCKPQTAWTSRCLAAPTGRGVAASSGSAVLHPRREGRRPAQIGKKGQSHPRWMGGGKRCCLLHQWGVICAWDCATAQGHATHLHPLMAQCDGQRLV